MAFGGFSDGPHARPMTEINTTPLVDVMLVLLIIFIITAPLLTHAVRIDLPKATSQPNPEKPETITLAIKASGEIFWNDAILPRDALASRFVEAAGRQPQPEVHLRADRGTTYDILAQVMAKAQTAGIQKLGFVTLPDEAQ